MKGGVKFDLASAQHALAPKLARLDDGAGETNAHPRRDARKPRQRREPWARAQPCRVARDRCALAAAMEQTLNATDE